MIIKAHFSQEACQCRPTKNLARTSQKLPPRLASGPLFFQSGRDRQIHRGDFVFAIGAEWVLFHRIPTYLLSVSSRFSISLAIIVQAANSGAGMELLGFFSPMFTRARASFG